MKYVMGLFGLVLFLLQTNLVFGCRISEFYCDNGECVGLDRFCDGVKDCQDGSDETKFCTRCNRTYYGDRHKTYNIDIDKPPFNKLPFVCSLTFMAGGGDLGDIVELSLERFQIGRLESPADGGCVNGHMRILERTPPDTSGHWCGTTTSIPVYYSETNNVTVVLTIPSSVSEDEHTKTAFQFALKFRYLSKADAVTRYGQSFSQYHRGEWIPTTACDRSFQDCDSQPCKLHSPNFPGVYPRNVTCYYHITQRTIPRGRHAFITIQQRNEDKLSIKADGTGYGGISREIAFRREKKLLFGERCTHDYIKIYDGSDTSAPLLAQFCRSGALAPVVSSSPEMLVEFHTTSDDLLELHHFELDVEVVFLPENDVGLRMTGNRCEWTMYADERGSGVIHSLRHLAAPNTSCSYSFRGGKYDIVWLYFVKYFVDNKGGAAESLERQPSIRGELYDGNPTIVAQSADVLATTNTSLLAVFDDETRVRLCVHARSFPNFIPLRPCRHPEESYLTTGPDLFLRYNFSNQFNLHYLHMEARYEFVDTYQDGEPLMLAPTVTTTTGQVAPPASSPLTDCNRVFRSTRRPAGTFSSPKNVFLYGRGGRKSLHCSYKFIGQESQTIRLTFRKIRLGNRKCDTFHDLHSRRHICQPHYNVNAHSAHHHYKLEEAEIRISQVLWNRVEILVACLCRMEKTLTVDLMSNVGHVNFSVTGMTSLEDFDSFYFEAAYEFLSGAYCNTGHVLEGGGGEISMVAGEADLKDGPTRIKCPWLLPANNDQFVHLRIPGVTPSEVCETNNRIIIFAADELEPVSVVCPSVRSLENGPNMYGSTTYSGGGATSTHSGNGAITTTGASGSGVPGEVEVFTKFWNKTVYPSRAPSNMLLVEFHASEPGRFFFKWSRSVKAHVNKLLGRKSRSEECVTKCSDGTSCSGSLFWCDLKAQCHAGSGGDGDDTANVCGTGAQFPWLYVGIGIGCGILVTIVLVASLLHRRRETKAKKGKPVPTDEYPMDGKEIDC